MKAYHMDDASEKTITQLLEAGHEICLKHDGALREFAHRAVMLKKDAKLV